MKKQYVKDDNHFFKGDLTKQQLCCTKLSLFGISPKIPALIWVWGKTETQNGSRKDKEIMNQDGKCGAIQKTTWALQGSARAAGPAWGPNAESQFRKGGRQRSLLSWLPRGDGSQRVWPEHTASDGQAPPPGSNMIPCIVLSCPISLVCTSHGAWSGDLRWHVFVTHCSELAGHKTEPTPHMVWRGVPRVGVLVGKKIQQLGRDGSETPSWSRNEGRELGAHTELSTGMRSGAERVQSTWLPLQLMG